MARANTYTAAASFTPGAAINVALEIAVPATKQVKIMAVELSQEGDTTTAGFALTIAETTAATTGWTATTLTPHEKNPSDAAASSTVKAYASGTSVDGGTPVVVRRLGANVLGLPYQWVPGEDCEDTYPAASFIVFKWVLAPPASTPFNLIVDFQEIG